MLHVVLIFLLATVSFTATQRQPEQPLTVGIMVKKDSPQGQTFETQDTTFVEREDPATESTKFLAEMEPTTQAPKLPNVELPGIGISGAAIPGSSDLLAVPDAGIAPGAMANTQFFGAQVWGSKFVYVIDRSGSMYERDRFGAAKRELVASLAKLPQEAKFQILFYNLNSDVLVQSMSPRLHFATDQNKTLALREMEKVIPEGGTNHLRALRRAVDLQPDVIFFLTDADDLRAGEVKEVTDWNKDRAKIHTIAFGIGPEVEGENRMRELADRNGGSYRYVDATRLGQRAGEGGP